MQDTKTMCHAHVDSVREIGCAYRVNVCGSVWQWLQGLAPSLVHRTESAASLVESRRVSSSLLVHVSYCSPLSRSGSAASSAASVALNAKHIWPLCPSRRRGEHPVSSRCRFRRKPMDLNPITKPCNDQSIPIITNHYLRCTS